MTSSRDPFGSEVPMAATVREVSARHGSDAAMGYRFRARVEHRTTRRGSPRWRFVGEYQHMPYTWESTGPGLPHGHRSRWFKTRAKAEAEANLWLDMKEALPEGEYVHA